MDVSVTAQISLWYIVLLMANGGWHCFNISFEIHFKHVVFCVCIFMQGHPCVIETGMELLKSITAVIWCLDTKPQSPLRVILRIRKSRSFCLIDFIKNLTSMYINTYICERMCVFITSPWFIKLSSVFLSLLSL